MKGLRIILFTLLIASLYVMCSCQTLFCEKTELTKSEARWYKHIKDSSVYIYKSDQGSIDTLICDIQRNGYTKCAPFETSNYEQRYIYINFFLSGNKGLKYKDDVTIKIQKEDKKKSADICFYVFDELWCGNFSDIGTVKFNSQNFRMKFTEPSAKKLKSFIWVDTLGLQSYTLASGERYQLFKILK